MLWYDHQRVRARFKENLYLFYILYNKYLEILKNVIYHVLPGMSTSYVHSAKYPRNPSMVDQKLAWGKKTSVVLFCAVCLYIWIMSFIYLFFLLLQIMGEMGWSCRWHLLCDEVWAWNRVLAGPQQGHHGQSAHWPHYFSTLFLLSVFRPLFSFWQYTYNRFSYMFQVKLICGKETTVTSTSEPSRCEYLMEFTTPAACPEPSDESQHLLHEEL